MPFINMQDLRELQDAMSRADRALRGDNDQDAARLNLVQALAILTTAADAIASPALRDAANEKYGTDDIEIDDEAGTAASDEGTWVAAWVFVRTPDPVQCERCQGNGEIVTDWERYMHADEGDKGDEAVTPCPDCDGTGEIHPEI